MNIDPETGLTISHQQIRQKHPALAIGPNADFVALGYPQLEETPAPVAPERMTVVKGPPEEYEPGKWRQTWATETIPVPFVVTPLQGLLALEAAGLAEVYSAWSSDAARSFSQRAFIDRATLWRRDSETIAAAAADLGITSTELDALFVLAATL